jgi:hypothetical protein
MPIVALNRRIQPSRIVKIIKRFPQKTPIVNYRRKRRKKSHQTLRPPPSPMDVDEHQDMSSNTKDQAKPRTKPSQAKLSQAKPSQEQVLVDLFSQLKIKD